MYQPKAANVLWAVGFVEHFEFQMSYSGVSEDEAGKEGEAGPEEHRGRCSLTPTGRSRSQHECDR